MDGERALRRHLADHDLGHHADALLAAGLPSIRLRPTPSGLEPEKAYRRAAPVEGIDGEVVAIATSGYHHLALLAGGTVMAWGDNRHGQLGDGTRADRRRPVPVAGLSRVVAVAAGGGTSVALLDDGSVLGWGSNDSGALGGGRGPDRLLPEPVPGLERDVMAVAVDRYLRVLKTDGSTWALGLHAGDAGGVEGRPVPIASPPAGMRPGEWRDGMAACMDGSVVAWPGYTVGSSPPSRVPGLDDVVALAGEHEYRVALKGDGSVLAWGASWSFPLGDGTTSPSERPVAVSGLDRDITAVAAGHNCGYALKADGSVWSWGWGYTGQLGNGTSEDRLVPAPVPNPEAAVVGLEAGLALKSDGTVWSWGGDVPAGDWGADGVLPVGASKLGGRPDLPPGTPWPAYASRPLPFMAQVRLADVAPLDRGDVLPESGLLIFFFDHLSNPIGATASVVGYLPEGTPLVRTEFPDELTEVGRNPAVGVVPEADVTLFPWAPGFLDEEESDRSGQVLMDAVEAGHRMLGYPTLIHDTPEPGAAVLLLQLDLYDEVAFPNSTGLLYFLISETDLRGRRFNRAEADYECD